MLNSIQFRKEGEERGKGDKKVRGKKVRGEGEEGGKREREREN